MYMFLLFSFVYLFFLNTNGHQFTLKGTFSPLAIKMQGISC